MVVLFEKTRHGTRIDIDTNTLFLGLSILLAGWGTAMILLRSQATISHLESDYFDFLSSD